MGKEEKSLEAKEKALAEKEEELIAKEKYFAELQDYLDKKEQELTEREKALAEKGPSVAPATAEKKPLTKDEQKLIEEGCKTYGIDKKYLFTSGIDPHTKEAILVTYGGKKVRYAKGMEVEPLTKVQIDGIPPRSKKSRVVMGKKK